MPAEYLPPQEFLVQCFDYNPKTGLFVWKVRPAHHFIRPDVAQMVNAQKARQPAFTWLSDGYFRADMVYDGRRVRLRAHRVAWKIVHGDEPEQIDHENGDRTDNRIANLRPATQMQNQRNKPGRPGRALPKGVYYDRGVLRAAVWHAGRSVKLGKFICPQEAHAAYCQAAKELHGEFFNPGPNSAQPATNG